MGLLRQLTDRALDASVFFSFDRSGFERHSAAFDPLDLDLDLGGRRCLVTGANSGIGRSTALQLAELGAEVWLLCRSQLRGEEALDDLLLATENDMLRLHLVDVSSFESIRELVARIGDAPIDVLVHNAGVLSNERVLTEDGLELAWATHVAGPFLLSWLLTPNLRAAAEQKGESRLIWVSSGGMYTQRLDLSDIGWESKDYDGVEAYAQTKRAQVILADRWNRELAGTDVFVRSMHPGWADTPAVRDSLPRFWRFTKNRLRTPRQGADTVVWLAASAAATRHAEEESFFFDREPAPQYPLPGTRESEEDREELWRLVLEQTGLYGSPSDGVLRPPSS
ncbi:MAG: SDR family NAD(P)-dependent oxidoreductase [Thermoanaerobaculia bacterium]|nr:SDR family NAD(P)-dependent oxidoreductase [Thermoanaerobaculia bacterium]